MPSPPRVFRLGGDRHDDEGNGDDRDDDDAEQTHPGGHILPAHQRAPVAWGAQAGRRAIGSLVMVPVIAVPWRMVSAPVTATLVQATALWLWHAPVLFDLALAHEGWHAAQHLSFLVSALFFWNAMLGRHVAAGTAALCLVATSIVSGALGALMAFATSPWYVGYARLGLAPFGLTPAEDQQLAGLLMWVPGGVVHAAAALFVMRRLLRTAHA